MRAWSIERGRQEKRADVATWLEGLDHVGTNMREMIVTAWTSAWLSSTHETLADMPYSLLAPGYQLARHVNEVILTGLDLAKRAEMLWGEQVDPEILVPILILHDVDKPLLYTRHGGRVVASQLARELPHGVPGAMLLRELDFPDRVVATVATHAANAPFHGSTLEARVLHYADFFSTDHALIQAAVEPFYQKHWR